MFKFPILISFFSSLLYLTAVIENTSLSYAKIDNDTPLIISNSAPLLGKPFDDIEKISNLNFFYEFITLNIDRTSELDLSKYKCKPVSFGYSVQEGKIVFPDIKYPPCRLASGINQSKLSINRTENLLKMNCNNSEHGYYFSGPVPNYNLMKLEHANVSVIHNYTSPILAEKLEYGLGFCSKHSIDYNKHREKVDKNLVQHASMVPIFNKTLYFNSLKQVKTKPKIIFMLTIDSFSRRHFYRKLPSVVKFLNQSQKLIPNVAVYDFLMHSTFSSKSITNQGPVLGGLSYASDSNRIGEDYLGKKSMWNYFKSKGYITFMGMDNCNLDFPLVLGENLNIDYTVRQFYCLAQQYSTFHSSKEYTEQRCIGPHISHYYVLNYTLELLRMYKGANMWIYLHLNAAHERTGQHAATLDSSLVNFLTDYFEITNNIETFMFLHADHGMRYGDWYTKVESYQETKLPSMFILASKSLLDKYPYSYHTLHENTKRLISKPDIRKTIYYLGENNLNMTYAVNMVNEIASFNRDCKNMNINPIYCACTTSSQLNPNDTRFFTLINIIKSQVEEKVNINTFNNPNYPLGKYCDQVIFDKVLNLYHMELDHEQEVYQIEYGTSNFLNVRMQANVIVFRNSLKVEYEVSRFKTFYFHTDKGLLAGRILNIQRLDKYGGKCQSYAQKFGIREYYCLRENC